MNASSRANACAVMEIEKPALRRAPITALWWCSVAGPGLVRFRRPRNRVPGLDLAGTVERVRAKVTRFAVGDEVFGRGSWSTAPPAVSARTPVQLGKAHGAEVTGIASTSKLDFVRSLGADHVVVDAQPGGPPDRYDLILDIGGDLTGGFSRSARAALRSPFVRQRFVMLASKERYEEFEQVAELITTGAVTPSVERTYPLEGVAEAMRHLEGGNVRGKLVITVVPAPAV